MDDHAKGWLVIVGVGVIAYTIGYRNGVRSMVRDWQGNVAPEFATYLAAKDTVTNILKKPDEDQKPE